MPKATESPLKTLLKSHTREGALWNNEKGNGVRCYACGHRCFIPEGFDGICKVRFNEGGKLRIPWGYVSGIQVDPIEKKPFYHVLPGANALSFGMLGCDFHCAYCQNWITSQAIRDPNAVARPMEVSPSELCEAAFKHQARVLTSTYNEPLITSEWAVEIFKEGKKKGLLTSFVSNGNGTPEVLEFIRPYVDLYKIDLKSFRDKPYRELGGVLQTVLDSIKKVYELGFFLEIVTLIVPGFNDDQKELEEMAQFLCEISPDIPWHVSAFHQDYKMQENDNTSVRTLLNACEIGKKAGLNYVYAGNLPGQVGDWENTYCHSCNELLIKRYGFRVQSNSIEDGKCPKCNASIPGVFGSLGQSF